MDLRQQQLSGMTSTTQHGDDIYTEIVNFTPNGEHLAVVTFLINDVVMGKSWMDLSEDKTENIYTHIDGMVAQEYFDTEENAAAMCDYAHVS